MSIRYIPITITNETVFGDGVSIGAKGSYDDVCLRVTFNEFWEDMAKHITWENAHGAISPIVYLTSTMYDSENGWYDIPVPVEAKVYEGEVCASIRGVGEGRASVSIRANFTVDPAVYDADYEESVQPTPTVADQLQMQIDAQQDEIEAILDSKGKVNGIASLDEMARVYPNQMPLLSDVPYFSQYMAERSEEIVAWSNEVADQIRASLGGYWKSEEVVLNTDIDPSMYGSAITVENYTPQGADVIFVYVNGFKISPSECRVLPLTNSVRIAFEKGMYRGNTIWVEIFRFGSAHVIEGMQVQAVTLDPDEEAYATFENNTLTVGIPKGETGNQTLQATEMDGVLTLKLV